MDIRNYRWLFYILAALLGLWIAWGLGETMICYITYRYSPEFVVLNPDASVMGICLVRHLIPLGFLFT